MVVVYLYYVVVCVVNVCGVCIKSYMLSEDWPDKLRVSSGDEAGLDY